MSGSHCNSCQENWKKPEKSIRLVVKKRTQKQADKSSNVLKSRNLNATEVVRTQLKRRNPFSYSPRKKPNISRPSIKQENVELFKDLDKVKSSNNIENVGTTNSRMDGLPNHGFEASEQPPSQAKKSSFCGKKLPVDWSLKTRLRFTSCFPFTWCSKLLGGQEAEGICKFVQCREQGVPNVEDGNHSINFQQNIMYWVHPVLPWLSLFPRLSSEIKMTGKAPSVTSNDDIANALQASWSQSFWSLFNLLRCGRCEYFYVCAAQSTMLFRASNVGGCTQPSVLITPTTKGIREAFDKEGISFSLPALHQSKSSSSDSGDEMGEEEETDLLNGNYEEEAGWLESMGVGEDTLPQLKQSKINEERVRLRNVDHQGSSVAMVTGSHTQALFNFLLNSKNLISKTGHLAGVPPTLIASVAFEGASLQCLSTKQGVIKQGKLLEEKYYLDIGGPILPGMLSKLSQLFETTQHCHFTAATKVLQATTPFNITECNVKTQQSSQGDADQSVPEKSYLGTTGLTHIKCEDGWYTWEAS